MSREVWKFEIPIDDAWHEVATPCPSRILHVACQDGRRTSVNLWAEVTPNVSATASQDMRVFGTGHPIPDGACYVGTAFGGPFVWHLYAKAAA